MTSETRALNDCELDAMYGGSPRSSRVGSNTRSTRREKRDETSIPEEIDTTKVSVTKDFGHS